MIFFSVSNRSFDEYAAEAFKQVSRLKYGRPKELLSIEILRRMGID
jgi:hypothetical protein